MTSNKIFYSKIITAIFVVFTLVLPAIVQAQQFLSAVQDVPVPDILTEDQQSQIIFDTVNGRVITSTARWHRAQNSPDNSTKIKHLITQYYQETMPSLGWRQLPKDPLSFKRDDEVLTISIKEHNADHLTVTYHLTPDK